MYRELNNIGQGKFISNERTPFTRNKLKGSKWGDLDGKYVDDEMYVVMNQVNRTFEKMVSREFTIFTCNLFCLIKK